MMELTIRQHLDIARQALGQHGIELSPEVAAQIAGRHVVAALEILNAATIVGGAAAVHPGAPKRRKSHRLVPDPKGDE